MSKILLVDDVELFLELEKSLLVELGHEIFTAMSGEEVLERIDSISPDLILLDLYMSGIDGDEVCRRLRKTAKWKALPIVMVTAAGRRNEVEKCLQSGCDDYVTKPVSKQELIEKVQRLLGKVKARKAPRETVGLPVHLECEAWSGTVWARDISRNGIFLETTIEFKINDIVNVTLDLPGDRQMLLIGKVARLATEDEGGCGIYIVHHEPEGEPFATVVDAVTGSSGSGPVEMRDELKKLQDQKQRLESDGEHLRTRIRELEEENLEFANQLVKIEDVNNNLTNLYVASSRLHSVLNQDQVVAIIKEIIINFVGAEKFALLMRPKDTAGLDFLTGEGFDEEEFPQNITIEENEIFRKVIEEKDIYLIAGSVIEGSDDPLKPLAAIPLVIHGEVTGLLVIYRLLVQKEKFEAIDYQLFSMMAEHAATAIFSSSLYEESERKRETYRGVMDLLLK
ncbi:MAG: hypothetical protein C0623_08860 [Desulfuromonas sp.]|nr:MAG: hypothetical protein C0623_08860 [Desulfuromonas sp.]